MNPYFINLIAAERRKDLLRQAEQHRIAVSARAKPGRRSDNANELQSRIIFRSGRRVTFREVAP